jgi:hypothetical protein
MALTLEAEQRLEHVGLVAFFEEHRDQWLQAAQQTYDFVQQGFPEGARIRRDDVAKPLYPILEVNELLTDMLDEKKLRGKFWKTDFVNLIIDRVWATISGEENEEQGN